MDHRAGAIFRKAIDTLLELPQMFREILVGSTTPDEENGLLDSLDCKSRRQSSQGFLERSRKRRRVTSEDDSDDSEDDIPQGHLDTTTQVEAPAFNSMETSKDDGKHPQCPAFEHGQAQYTPYAEETHMVNHHDGTRDQMALLFTEDMAVQIMNIGKESRLVEQQERLVHDLEREILIAKVGISSLQSNLESLGDEEEVRAIREEIEGYEETLRRSSERRDNVNTELAWNRRDEKLSRNRLQNQLESILAQSGLLDPSSLEPSPVNASTHKKTDDCHSMPSDHSGEIAPAFDPETSLRCAAQEEMDIALGKYLDADEAFDSFDDFQWNERQDYKAQVLAGNIDISQEEFDHMMIGEQQQRTRDLAEATDRYKGTLEQAKAMGLYTGQWDDMGPENREKFDGFYDEDVEAAILKQTDPTVIERWRDVVCAEFGGPQDMGGGGTPDDVEKWETSSVGMSSGFSVVEWGMYRDKICSWKEHCSLLREERLARVQGRPVEGYCCASCDRRNRDTISK